MTLPLLFSMYTPVSFLQSLKKNLTFDLGEMTLREFPDQESYIKFNSDLKNRNIIFVVSLDKPNSKFLPLIFALRTARELEARNIGLILPYLPYMRQDKRFLPGEAVTSKIFSPLLSECIDWMITIDPHLHRYHSLSEIYSIPTYVLQASDLISNWVQNNVTNPLFIGPDSESEQWVSAIATSLSAPCIILEKTRKGDRDVQITFPSLRQYNTFTPILVDDIISSGTTMIETISHLKKINMQSPICIGVHAVFSDNAYDKIISSGAKSVVTCNTIEHMSNSIDVAPLIADYLKKLHQSTDKI